MNGVLSARFRPRMLALATSCGLLVATLPSLVHTVVRRSELRSAAAAAAAALAQEVRAAVLADADLWRYDSMKHARIARMGFGRGLVSVSLFDGAGRLLHQEASPDRPAVLAESEVTLGGRTVARVAAGMDASDALRSAMVLHVSLSAAGAVLAVLLYLVPLGIVVAGERGLRTHESERARIARDLHDGVGQLLTAARLHVMTGAREAALAAVDEAADELRRVVSDLRPARLEDSSLADAVRALAREVVGEAGIELDLEIRDTGASDPRAEAACWRIAQEAFNNVARHSGAGRVRVSLARVRGEILLEVEDDGQGLSSAPEGRGMRGMRARAAELGGTCSIGAGQGGRGTLVSARIPAWPGRSWA